MQSRPGLQSMPGMDDSAYPIEVDVTSAAAQLKETGTLLDVREPMELNYCKIQGSLHIPMGQVPHRLADIPREGPVYVICHHGMRSGQVTTFLRQRGFENAINIAGGIEAWSSHVDPEIPKY